MFAEKETCRRAEATMADKRPARRAPEADRERQTPFRLMQRNLGNSVLRADAETRGIASQASGAGRIPAIQRACACGSCASCAGKDDEKRKVQAKLTIGAADDAYEQEAERVADRVMRMPDAPSRADAREPARDMEIRRKGADGGNASVGETDIDVGQHGGEPLSSATRTFMEPRFRADFSHVRLHADDRSHEAAAQIQARAFTYGSHIWLGKGESERDGRLMAHELTHVVQQGGARTGGDASVPTDTMSGDARIQRDVRRECPGGWKTVTVDMVSLRGSTRNPLDDLAFANTIFRPCCVQFQLGTGVSVTDTTSDGWLGGDTDLHRLHSCSAVDAEEDAMRVGATGAFGLSSRIRVFYVETMTPAERGVSFPAFCASGARASFVDHAYISNTGARRSLAHEFGHILLNSGSHTGIDNPADTGNLMVPTNSATGETLDPTQCTTIFGNA
jgi:uncharacterized protein DUF4157